MRLEKINKRMLRIAKKVIREKNICSSTVIKNVAIDYFPSSGDIFIYDFAHMRKIITKDFFINNNITCVSIKG